MSTSNVKKTESITIGGSDTLYGGKIYYVDFKNDYSSPIKLQVNVVSKQGQGGGLTQPKINLSSPEKVKIKSIDLDLYLYKYKIRSSSQGTIMELHYIDGSFELDKIYIGLQGKHGWTKYYGNLFEEMHKYTFNEIIEKNKKQDIIKKAQGQKDKFFNVDNPNFWILGRLMHPCDENKDNIISFDEAYGYDPCDPCPSCPEQKYENRCFEILYSSILEFQYPFQDFLDAFNEAKPKIGNKDLTINAPSEPFANIYKKYYKNYVGTLREVLTAWCNDFGFSWYIDLTSSSIEFLDLAKKPLIINSDEIVKEYKGQDTLIGYESGADSMDTFDSKVISWYQRPGEKKQYECSKSQYQMLRPFYGLDFIGNRTREAYKGGQVDGENDVMSAILGAYHPILREIYWHRAIYKIHSKNDAAEYITSFSSSPSSNLDPESDLRDQYLLSDPKLMPELGNVKVLGIVSSPPHNGDETFFQKKIKNEYANLLELMNDYETKRFKEATGFFIVAYCDEVCLQKRLEMENELYDFIGRWYSAEHMFRLCGITGNDEFVKNNTQIEAGEGTARILSKKDEIGTHPFSKYKYYKYGYLSCILGTGNNMDEKNPLILDSMNKKRFEQTAILLDREPKWVPEPQVFQETHHEQIVQNYGNLVWKLMGEPLSNTRTYSPIPTDLWIDWIFKEVPDLKKSDYPSNIKVFAVYPGVFEKKQIQEASKIPHPIDKKKTIFEARKDTKMRGGGKWSSTILPIGLTDDSCTRIKIDSLTPIHTPPHTFAGGGNRVSNQAVIGNSPCNSEMFRPQAYRIAVTQSFSQKINVPKILTGDNQSMITGTVEAKAAKLKVLYNDVSDDDIKFFKESDQDSIYGDRRGAYGCIPDLEKIKKIHENYNKNSFKNTGASDFVSVNIKGLPNFKVFVEEVKRGLNNFSIQINENGVESTINYSSKPALNISDDLIKKYQLSRSILSRNAPF
jgi:hypothetical protein